MEGGTNSKHAQVKLREGFFKQTLSGKCLEIGCGSGAVAKHLYELNREGVEEFLAVDPNADLVEHAKKSAVEFSHQEDPSPSRLNFDVGWLGTLETSDEEDDVSNALEQTKYESYFDHVLLLTTLSHIDVRNYTTTLEQALNLLKPGGTLHVFDNDLTNRKVEGADSDLLVSGYRKWLSTAYSEFQVMHQGQDS